MGRTPYLVTECGGAERCGDMGLIITIAVSAVAALVLLWLVLFLCLALLRPEGTSLRDAARTLPDVVRLVHRLARDRDLSRSIRARLAFLLVYLALPIDLIPDFIPLLGYADDAIITGIVLRSVIRRAGPDVVRRHWPGSDEGLAIVGRLCRVDGLTSP